jgi:hypothetical protein
MTPEIATIVSEQAPEKTMEQLANAALISSFVDRYSKVRRPGLTLQFLKAFLQETAADKVREDAQSVFGSLPTTKLAELLYTVDEALHALAVENLAKQQAEQEAAAAAAQAAKEAKDAEAKAVKEAANQAKLDARAAKKAAKKPVSK